MASHNIDFTASDSQFDLSIPQDARRPLAMAWLGLGMLALLASGLFSILLVLSRTPQLQTLFPVADFFRVALVVHVDLSVLVWFLSFGGALWTLSGTPRFMSLAWGALALAALGTLLMCLSPFVERAVPVMANYVPVLEGPVFLGGLVLFGAGITLLCLRSMLAAAPVGMRISGNGALRFGLNAAMVSCAVAAFAFVWSWAVVPRELDARIYYELVFWGGGHVLQFAYTLLMLVGWIWLASSVGAQANSEFPLSPRVVTLLFAIALLAVFLTPITYLAYDVASVEHHRIQTLLMRFGGGLIIAPIALAVLWYLRLAKGLTAEMRPLRASLIASLLLFSAGGVIGFMISGNNVRIPAHYHGCIVGVTLAMMGVVYHLLPKFGFAAPKSRYAAMQPAVYGVGQLMHIVGLVWSGGYGVQRKVAGAEQVLRTTEETWGMGLMGLGGLIAIIGGVMFVVIVLRALRGTRESDMATILNTPAQMKDPKTRWLQAIGACGAVLALAILGASMLLRVSSIFGVDGQVISTLPVAIENLTRLTHRLAASSVGLLALLTVIFCWTRRPLPSHLTSPIAWLVAVTVILALIGPLTPGYRIEAVTIANVLGGMLLLMAFWWLRESVATHALARKPITPLLGAAVLVFLLHVATGAAASAYEMHNVRGFAFIHFGTSLLATMFIGASLWDRRHVPSLSRWIVAIVALMVAQVGLGFVLMSFGVRPVWLAFVHGMLSPLLGIALVSLTVRDTTAP